MSVPLDPTQSMWYESMQDMSGYVVLTDTILPQSDEQIDPINSTAQYENDFDVRNHGLPSRTEDFILGDTYEDVLVEESDMFSNNNYETLDPKTDECSTESPFKRNIDFTHSDQTRTITNMGDGERNFQQLSFWCPKVKSISSDKSETQKKFLEIIDSEEPLIKDPDLMYCTQNKMDLDIRIEVDVSNIFSSEETNLTDDMDKVNYSADFKDMGVAEEVVVTTEVEDEFKLPLLEGIPNPEEELDIPEEKNEGGVVFQQDPFGDFDIVMGGLFNNLDEIEMTADEIGEVSDRCPNPAMKDHQLSLDIGAARALLLDNKGITDTPEILEALESKDGKFDLIEYITANGDPNNNSITPTVPFQKKFDTPRKGKSLLSLEDLKQAQTKGRGKSVTRKEDEGVEQEPVPSTSGICSSGRPPRKSASRFKKMIEEGFLNSTVDSQSLSSDEEDDSPRAKRRRTTSTTSSRRRLNSDSDRSSISEDAMRYRERRDRNNLSSKRSRQKRKLQFVMKEKELKELEEKNSRLQQTANELESVLTRVKAAWADYLARTKDKDKDRR